MPWAYPSNIPRVAKNWTPGQQRKCIKAGNAVLRGGGSDQDAIFACIRAAGKTKNPGGKESSTMRGTTDVMVDLFAAARVLAGEKVCLVPLMLNGFHRGGVKKPPITEEDLAALVRNFEQRATSGFYQETIPLNKEHEESEGKIGSIAALTLEDDGAYAIFDLTPKGRQALEDEAFDYLSPEIRWKTTDVTTGEEIGPTLAGAAVTNYPFFGGRTAMYSQAAYDKLAEDFPTERFWQKSMAALMCRFDQFGEWMESLEGGDPTDDNGSPDPDNVSDDPDDSQQEDTMSDKQMQIPPELAEQFSTMQATIAELQSTHEQYAAQLEERDTTIQAQGQEIDRLSLSRVSDRFTRQAEDYQAIGADNGDLAEHLTWLYMVDATEGRPHFTFFNELLATVDKGLAESASFSQQGHEEEVPSSVMAKIEAQVAKRAKEMGVEAPIGSEQYNQVLDQVLSEDAELYEQYRLSVAHARPR